MTRKVEPHILYDGADITADIGRFVTSMTYRDVAGKDASDELTLELQDAPALWRGSWFPTRGSKISAKLVPTNWREQGDRLVLDCGVFEIDSVESSGWPSKFTIKALAIGAASAIRSQERTRRWVDFTLSRLANEIASRYGFKNFFKSSYDPTVAAMEQRKESDLAFLSRVCEYAGLMLKATDGKLVVVEAADLDAQAPALKIVCDRDTVKSYRFGAGSAGTYVACECRFSDGRELRTYVFRPNGTSGLKQTKQAESKNEKTLILNRICSSMAEAEAIAKAALRKRNSGEITGSLTLLGSPTFASGLVVGTEGFGVWDAGKYLIDEAVHTYSSGGGYSADLTLRGVLGF